MLKTGFKKSVALMAVFLVVPFASFAATIGSGDEYSLGGSETLDDNLYVGSGNVSIAGKVTGDLLVGGGNILVSGEVEKDAVLAGGNINIVGEIKDDARLVGGQIVVGSNVAGDLVAAGGSVHVLRDASIGSDALLGGGRVVVDGNIDGDLRLGAGEIVLNGTVKGDVSVMSSQKISIGKDAVIEGDFMYNSPSRADIASGATIKGKVEFKELPIREREAKGAFAGVIGFIGLMKFLAAALLVSLLAIFLREKMTGLSRSAMDNFGHELVRGLIIFLVVPVVSIILVSTVLGAAVGAVMLLAFIFLAVLAMFVDAIIIGSWIAKVMLKKQEIEVSWKNAILGVFLLSVASLIPIVGWIFVFVFFLVALGVLGNAFYAKLRG